MNASFVSITPFASPVVPPVYMSAAVSDGLTVFLGSDFLASDFLPDEIREDQRTAPSVRFAFLTEKLYAVFIMNPLGFFGKYSEVLHRMSVLQSPSKCPSFSSNVNAKRLSVRFTAFSISVLVDNGCTRLHTAPMRFTA